LAVGPTSDLFSLGSVLYQLLTGQQPFYRPTLQATMAALVLEQPTPPHELNLETSPALSDLVMWLLAKNPLDRPGSAQAVIEALGAVERGKSGEYSSQSIASGLSSHSGRPPSRYGRYLVQGLLFLLTVGLVAVIALWLITTDGELAFQSDDPDLDVKAEVEKAKVVFYDLSADPPKSVPWSWQRLPAGNYRLEAGAADRGLIFDPRSFTIVRGKTTVIMVRQDKKSRDHF
jgi:serine/threonine protein kinase